MLEAMLRFVDEIREILLYKIENKKIINVIKRALDVESLTKAVFCIVREEEEMQYRGCTSINFAKVIAIDELITIKNIRIITSYSLDIYMRFSVYVSDYLCVTCIIQELEYCKLFDESPVVIIQDDLALPDPLGEEINKWSKKILDKELIIHLDKKSKSKEKVDSINDDILKISEKYKK